jgi:hypothetical protein
MKLTMKLTIKLKMKMKMKLKLTENENEIRIKIKIKIKIPHTTPRKHLYTHTLFSSHLFLYPHLHVSHIHPCSIHPHPNSPHNINAITPLHILSILACFYLACISSITSTYHIPPNIHSILYINIIFYC